MKPANIEFIDLVDEAALEHICLEIDVCNISMDDPFLLEWFSDAVLLTQQTDDNISYHGRDCEAGGFFLYKFRGYYIIYDYFTSGDDLEVLSIYDQFGSSINFLEDRFKVYDEIDIKDVAARLYKIDSIFSLFKNYYEDWKPKLIEYISDRADLHV